MRHLDDILTALRAIPVNQRPEVIRVHRRAWPALRKELRRVSARIEPLLPPKYYFILEVPVVVVEQLDRPWELVYDGAYEKDKGTGKKAAGA